MTSSGPDSALDLDDAERKAGFRPVLPSPGVLTANPSISIIGPITLEQTVHRADLEAALNKAGVRDVTVPQEWEGVQLRANLGPMVNLGYPDEVGILEARPVLVAIPDGFPLQAFRGPCFSQPTYL